MDKWLYRGKVGTKVVHTRQKYLDGGCFDGYEGWGGGIWCRESRVRGHFKKVKIE